MTQPLGNPPSSVAISYATPGTYRSPRRYTGVVIASYIIATLETMIWISVLFLGIANLREARRELEDPVPSVVLICVALVMTALAVTLLIAAAKLRSVQPLGFRLHRGSAIAQLLANATIFFLLSLLACHGDVLTLLIFVVSPIATLSIYPVIVLSLLKDSDGRTASSGASSATSP
jgi:hypothetical protein